jgi:isochorismate hydrolase
MSGVLRRGQASLLVIDVQERLANVMPERQRMVERCVRLVKGFRKLELPIYLTEQYPEGLGPTVPELREVLGDIEPLLKMTFSCCGLPEQTDHPLLKQLTTAGRRQLVLCGMEAHVCVLQTALTLHHHDYDVHVVEDAVCSRDEAHQRNALRRLGAAGVSVTNYESVLFEVLEDAAAPEFRQISKLVR